MALEDHSDFTSAKRASVSANRDEVNMTAGWRGGSSSLRHPWAEQASGKQPSPYSQRQFHKTRALQSVGFHHDQHLIGANTADRQLDLPNCATARS